MDFQKDLEDIILKKLNDMGIKVSYDNVSELLLKYLDITFKLVDLTPRKVLYSTELKSKIADQPYFDVLKIVEEKFEKGEDITPHLSRRVFDPKFRDGLLNERGIKHLHLSNTKKNPQNKFYDSSDYLLMFIHGLNCVCFIDVRPHSESRNNNDPEYPLWVRDELTEIVQKNWPKLLEGIELKDVEDVKQYTREEHKRLRDAGATLFSKIGDKVYFPLKIYQTRDYIKILNLISGENKRIKNNPEEIKEIMRKNGINPPSELEFILIDDPTHGLVCLEKNTNWGYSLDIQL
jgi:hypothetical protein